MPRKTDITKDIQTLRALGAEVVNLASRLETELASSGKAPARPKGPKPLSLAEQRVMRRNQKIRR